MPLVIDAALDLWLSTIEAVVPVTAPNIEFKRHRAAAPLENSQGAVRYFGIYAPKIFGNDANVPRSDGVSFWVATDQFFVKIWYPKDWVIKGDTTARGVDAIRLEDTIRINQAIVYNDFLNPIGADSYESPQFLGAYEEGFLWVLQYRFAWQEVF